MPDLSFVVAAAIAKFVARVWVGDNSVDGVAEDIKDVFIRVHGTGAGQRRAALQMDGIAESISERIVPFLDREIPGLEDGERLIAVETVSVALRSVPVSTVRDLIDKNMNATHLANLIRDAIDRESRSNGLSEAGEALQERLLVESALYVLEIATRLPQYEAVRDELLLSRTSKIEQLVEEVLARLPAFESTGARSAEDEKFEHLYRIAVQHRTDQVRLFGLQGQASSPHYPLSVAYISLAIDSTASRESDDIGDGTPSSTTGVDAPKDAKLEDLLVESKSLLLVGGAGSGKTTLLNWVGLSSVSPSVATRVPESWRERIPFILPLRQFATETLPSVEDLPGSTAPTLGPAPHGWARRVFDDGRATLLVDGLDEVSKRRRGEVHAWLTEILALFPETHVVVSTRPIGLPRQWHEDSNFTRADILPMRPDDTRVFIQKWHQAAASAGNLFGFRSFAEAERAMQEIARTRPAIRSLSNTPLLCALICALHLKQGSNLPKNRIELYDTALIMLLAARDNERKVEVSLIDLSQAQRRNVIREFALWMHENGLADASEHEYLSSVQKTMQRIVGQESNAQDAASFLLERSGVLREPAPQRIDFVHRTFLEYLAACAIVEDNSIEKLVLHAEDDRWREVVVLAAGVAQKHQREQLLRRLLEVGRERPGSRHRLFLLAIACLETAPELALDLRKELEAAVSEVVPPKSMTEASSIASAGQLAVPLLRSVPGLKARPAAASVRALCIIGTDDALDSLSSYSAEHRLTVTRELWRGWPNFDPERYAKAVLSGVDLTKEPAVVADPSLVEHTSHLRSDARIFLDLPERFESVEQIPNLPESIYGANFSGLRGVRSLRDVPLANAESLVLDSTPLETLVGIEDHPNLFFFSASNCSELRAGGDLSGHDRLNEFIISGATIENIDFVSNLKRPARRMTLSQVSTLKRITEPVHSRSLRIIGCDSLREFSGLPRSASIENLTMHGTAVRSLDLPPQLRTVQLRQVPTDIAFTGASGLTSATIPVESLETQTDWLAHLKDLRSLNLYSGQPQALSAPQFAGLTRLCESVERLDRISFSSWIDVPISHEIDGFVRIEPRTRRYAGSSHTYGGTKFERHEAGH